MPTLHWIGKEKVINHHLDVPFRVLEHTYGFQNNQQTNAETDSGNKIIHGDNLEALKSLLPEYEGRVKCIYIDPPYNTGNEKWIYNDNVNDPKIRKWLGEVVGPEGEDLTRHDKWLCMMYPRLKLLHKLLADDGVIFISIDDNEQANLKLICDEIFGAKNFVTIFVWQKKTGAADSKGIASITEYILCYCNNTNVISDIFCKNFAAFDAKRYRHTDKYYEERGPFYYDSLDRGSIRYSDSLNYAIIAPDGTTIYPNGRTIFKNDGWTWKWSKEKVDWGLQNGFISIEKNSKSKNGWSIRYKIYLFVDNEGNKTEKSVPFKNLISDILNADAAAKMKEIFQIKIFDYAKPVELINKLLSCINLNQESIILDSFAGSGTTAHAVLSLNKTDGGHRKFILVEMGDYAENITAERVKRVISGYRTEKKYTLFDENITFENLKNGEQLFNQAFEIYNEAKEKYSSVKKPKIINGHLLVEAVQKAEDEVAGLGGSFDYYELGQPLFADDGNLNENVDLQKLRQYIVYTETKTAFTETPHNDNKYFLCKHNNTAYYFNYEPDKITTLDYSFFAEIKTKAEQYVVYADNCLLAKNFMNKFHIVFKKIPRDITLF